MSNENERATFEYMNLFRGYIGIDSFVPAALLIAETKEECDSRKISNDQDQQTYETMLTVANRLNVVNPFRDEEQFMRVYRAYSDLTCDLDWEMLVAESASGYRYSSISNALFNEYDKHFKLDADSVLIVEGEKFIPNLKRLIDEIN